MRSELVKDLKGREKRNADIKPARVVGPVGSGRLWKMTYPGDTTVWVAKAAVGLSLKPGQIVPTGSNLGAPSRVIIQESAPGQIGTAEFTYRRLDPVDASTQPLIYALEPSQFEAGATNVPATASGINFRGAIDLAFVRYSAVEGAWLADPFLTAHDALVASTTTIDLQVDVAENAPAGYLGDRGII